MTDFTLSRIIIIQHPHKHVKSKFVGRTCCRIKITICFVVAVAVSTYSYRAKGCFYLLLESQKEKKLRQYWGSETHRASSCQIKNKAEFSQFVIKQ